MTRATSDWGARVRRMGAGAVPARSRGALFAAAVGLPVAGCATVVEPVLPPGWTAADAAQPLGHADCVRLAVRFAPNAAAWQARLDAAQAALDQAGTLPDPLLGLTAEGFGWFRSVPAAALTATLSLGMELDRLFS